MVDLNLDQLTQEWRQLKELFESGVGIDAIKNKFNDFGQDLTKLKNVLPDLTGGFSSVVKEGNKLLEQNLGTSLDNWTKAIENFGEASDQSSQDLKVMGVELLSLTPLFSKFFPLPNALAEIGKEARGSTASLKDMLDTTLKLFGPVVNNMPGGKQMAAMLNEAASRGDYAKDFESGLLRMAAGTGQLSKALKGTGSDFGGLSLKTEAYSKLVYEVANASGLSATQVGGYAKELMIIPGALDNFGGATNKTVGNISYLDAVLKTAAGTGQDFQDVLKDLTFEYQYLGTTGKTALEEVSRMQSISDFLGVPLQNIKNYAQDSAKSFKLLGDNTQGALDIMARFGPTFKEAGMGPEAINEIVSGITQGISKMETAQKAFLSGQTGGAKGLQGAFQIDLAIKQGNLDQVYKKVEENLRKRFGGQVLTLEQASQSSQGAAQFQKQIQYLRSPAMGGIANSDQAAMRILEAMSKGTTKELPKGLATPDKSLSNAMKTGDKLQERQTTILTTINNWAERQAQIQSIIAYNTARMAGQAGPLSSYLNNLRKESGEVAKSIQPVEGRGIHGGKTANEVVSKEIDSAGKMYGDLKNKTLQVFNKMKSQIQTGDQNSGEINDQSANQTPTQFARKNIVAADKNTQQRQGIDKAAIPGQKGNAGVNVSVTTVCSQCQRKIAQDEAKTVVDHYHQKDQLSNYHAGQTF